ncbi:unnamed protein product [Cylindrotheca closterium]|uniref:Flavin reductase like domain-containing protein n=1 Tax=Cylindrotheca closterium TaxID=2856 RepID=A0AAD2FQE4_9STRA|nr:unnamed protein product [Cylindrotheca closterium]
MRSIYTLFLCFFIGSLIKTNSSSGVVVALSSSSEHLPTECHLQPTTVPPLLDVPTYSLATYCHKNGGQTGMNILTYASPISIRPDRIWALGLYKGTWTHEQFVSSGEGVLQLLAPKHATLVKVLGGSSTRDVNKQEKCAGLGMPWIPFSAETNNDEEESSSIQVLPGCVHYLKVRLVGDLIDCGSHDLAMCKVESMSVPSGDVGGGDDDTKQALMTSQLREMGIITAQGRVAED